MLFGKVNKTANARTQRNVVSLTKNHCCSGKTVFYTLIWCL
jgi:hypothetical protein